MYLHQRTVPTARIHSRSRRGRALLILGIAIASAASVALATGSAIAAERPSPSISGVVNVNTASVDELQLLPGVGESRAAAIVDTRKASGGFKSVDELANVKGVGSKLLEQMRPFVTLQGKTTAKRL